jgi:hypothetical protein
MPNMKTKTAKSFLTIISTSYTTKSNIYMLSTKLFGANLLNK